MHQRPHFSPMPLQNPSQKNSKPQIARPQAPSAGEPGRCAAGPEAAMHKAALCDGSGGLKGRKGGCRGGNGRPMQQRQTPGPPALTCDDQREERTHNGNLMYGRRRAEAERRRTRRGRDGSERKTVWAAVPASGATEQRASGRASPASRTVEKLGRGGSGWRDGCIPQLPA